MSSIQQTDLQQVGSATDGWGFDPRLVSLIVVVVLGNLIVAFVAWLT